VSKYLRAQDVVVTVRRDGEPLLPISVNSGSFDRGLGMEEIALTGQSFSDVDGTNGVKTLQLDLNPRNPDFHTLLDVQEAKNAGVEEYLDAIIDAEFTLDFGRDGRTRYVLPDCVASDVSHSFAGGTERVTAGLTLTSGTVKRLA
jgi:hypothetical protein